MFGYEEETISKNRCTELVGHKIARLNHKSFFYLNHQPLVHCPLRPTSTKGNFALLSLLGTPISNVNQKNDNTCRDISGHVPVTLL